MITKRQPQKITTYCNQIHTDISHVVSVIMTRVREAACGGRVHRARAIMENAFRALPSICSLGSYVDVVQDRDTSRDYRSLVRFQPIRAVESARTYSRIVAQSGRAIVKKILCSLVPVHSNIFVNSNFEHGESNGILHWMNTEATLFAVQIRTCLLHLFLLKLQSCITGHRKVYALGGVWSGLLQYGFENTPCPLVPRGASVSFACGVEKELLRFDSKGGQGSSCCSMVPSGKPFFACSHAIQSCSNVVKAKSYFTVNERERFDSAPASADLV